MKKLFTILALCALCAPLTCSANDTRHLPLRSTYYTWTTGTDVWTENYSIDYTVNDMGYYTSRTTKHVYDNIEDERETTNYYEGTGLARETITERSSDKGATWNLELRTTQVYDDVVPTFPVDYQSYSWEADGSWKPLFFSRYVITRNEQKIITKLVYQQPFGSLECANFGTLENTLSADGSTITAMKAKQLDFGTLTEQVTLDLRDIVWHNTDGQILSWNPQLYAGSNRIASAKLYSGDELYATLTGTYPNDYEGTLVYEYDTDLKSTYTIRYTDEATKSYELITETQSHILGTPTDDINGDGVVNSEDAPLLTVTETTTDRYGYDSHGNMIYNSQERIFTNGSRTYYLTEYENTYNADGALTEVITYTNNGKENEKTPVSRIVNSDFRSFSGVAEVETDDSDAPVEYYNLQGLRVAHPEGGIFIRRQGSKVSKVRM